MIFLIYRFAKGLIVASESLNTNNSNNSNMLISL